LLLGMNLSVQPRVRNLIRGLGAPGPQGAGFFSGCGARGPFPREGTGVWVREGEEVLEILWEMGFKCSATPKAATWWSLWTTRGTPRPS